MNEPRPQDWMSDDRVHWVADGRTVLVTDDPDWRERVTAALPPGVRAWYVDGCGRAHRVTAA